MVEWLDGVVIAAIVVAILALCLVLVLSDK